MYGSECPASDLWQQEEPAETTTKAREKVNRITQCPKIGNIITDIQLWVKKKTKPKRLVTYEGELTVESESATVSLLLNFYRRSLMERLAGWGHFYPSHIILIRMTSLLQHVFHVLVTKPVQELPWAQWQTSPTRKKVLVFFLTYATSSVPCVKKNKMSRRNKL